MVRVLRGLPRLRKSLSQDVLATAVSRLASAGESPALLALFGGSAPMAVGEEVQPQEKTKTTKKEEVEEEEKRTEFCPPPPLFFPLHC